MKVALAFVLLAACDAGDNKAPAPVTPSRAAAPPVAPARPLVKTGNWIRDCAADLQTPGVEHSPRVLDATGCSLLENPTAGGGESWVIFLLDASSPAELARYVRCETVPRVDWERDRVVVGGYQLYDLSVRSVWDDQATHTFVFKAGNRYEPKHDDWGLDYGLAFALVPRERRSDFRVCGSPDALAQ